MPAPTLPSENPAASAVSPSGYAIEFDNVSIAFDEKVVLDSISFQLPHGETKALFGVAGSGKSTLLKLAIGLMRPDSGRIFVLGEEVTSMSEQELFELRRRVAIARAIITEPEVLLYDSPTGGLDPVTSNTIVELIVKQRDVYKTSALMVTHRLQDAFTMATHQFEKAANQMVVLPKGQRCEMPMSFLILRDGKVIFNGDAQQLATSRDDYIREYIS